MPKNKNNKNLGENRPMPVGIPTNEATGSQPGSSGLTDSPTCTGVNSLTNTISYTEPTSSGSLTPCTTKCDLFAEESDEELNVDSITSINEEVPEEEIKVEFLNPAFDNTDLPTYRSVVRVRPKTKHEKILDDTNWQSDTVEDAKKRLTQIAKPLIIKSIVNEVIETALANTNDAGINDAHECTVQNASEVIARDVVNKIINNTLPDEKVIYEAEYYDSGRISQVMVDGTTMRRRSFLPYMPLNSKVNFIKMFKQLFLPHGFPETVSSDYAEYQVWDSLQAFFSTLTGALTTHSVMKGVGVGDAKATAVSAAITWLLRDGTGLVGRIMFAYWKGTEFDMDCKKWRFFADILNDGAMFLECLIPVMTPSRPLFLLCLSTSMKSIVGVAGGATRAAITQHQAIRGNMADVSAKDQSQESCVNLIASLIGIVLLMTVADSSFKWDMFVFFVFCHLACNYRAVRAVQLATLNTSRFILILRGYLTLKTVGSVKAINRNESVLLGQGLGVAELCGYKIHLGASLLDIRITARKFIHLSVYYAKYNYMLYVDNAEESIQVFLKETATPIDIIQAFYHAIILAIGTCIKDHVYLLVISRQIRSITNTPIDYLADIILDPHYNHRNRTDLVMKAAGKVVQHEFPLFLADLQGKGWDTEHLLFDIGEWRASV